MYPDNREMDVDYMDHDINYVTKFRKPQLVTQTKLNNLVWEMNLSQNQAELTLP